LSPAKIIGVKVEDKNTATVFVPEDQLSLAIGKDGRNVRLAANLTGWKIDIKPTAVPAEDAEGEATEEEAEKKEGEEKPKKEKKAKAVKKPKKVKEVSEEDEEMQGEPVIDGEEVGAEEPIEADAADEEKPMDIPTEEKAE
jgi:N utilization substance protein A